MVRLDRHWGSLGAVSFTVDIRPDDLEGHTIARGSSMRWGVLWCGFCLRAVQKMRAPVGATSNWPSTLR